MLRRLRACTLGSALLGPSLLGRMLPHGGELFAMLEGWVQITTIGGYAFMLQIFVIGVRTDLGMIVKSGKKAVHKPEALDKQ